MLSGPRLDYPEEPVWAILAGAATRWPDRIALRSGDTSLTWGRLWSRSVSAGSALRAAGFGAGDVAAFVLGNGIDFAVWYWACQLVGMTVSPVNPRQPATGIAGQFQDSGAAVVLTDAAGERLLPQRHGLAVLLPQPVRHTSSDAGFRPYRADDATAAISHIIYTGGTTGVPKGVAVSQRGVLCNAMQFCAWATGSVPSVGPGGTVILDQVGSPEDWPVRLGTGTTIAVAPWFHAMGLVGGLVNAALQGTTSIVLDRIDAGTYLAAVQRHRVTSVSGAPTLLAGLTTTLRAEHRDVDSVRLVSAGGAALAPELADRLAVAFPRAVVTQAYGLTEVTMAAVGNPTGRRQHRNRGSVGLPLPDTEIRLLPTGENGEEAAQAENGRGEILIRGPQLMLGYHRRDAETRQAIREGWLHTGDIGAFDEHGYLTIVGRKKDMLIYKGYNVYPAELEGLLRDQPGVRDAAVVGVEDPEVGEIPVAFVVPDGTVGVDADALADKVNAQVLHYKKLRAVHVVDSFPTSAIGKVLKSRLREKAREHHHG